MGRFKMPERSLAKEEAHQIIKEELKLDGNPTLYAGSFVTTARMEHECDDLIMDSLNKNCVDVDEYPATAELQVNIIFHFFLLLQMWSVQKGDPKPKKET